MSRVRARRRESGFSMLELLLVVAVICVVATMAFMQVARARERTRLEASARELTSNLERARADSIRRHAGPGQQASVTVADATSYTVVADYNSNGTIEAGESRTIQLAQGVTFETSPTPPSASFDWRGRIAESTTFRLTNSTDSTNVSLTVAGDATLNSTAVLPALSATPFPTPTPTPAPAAAPPPAPPSGIGGCSIGLYPDTMTIKKSGKETGILELKGSIYGDPGQATITFDSTLLKLSYGSPLKTAKSGDVFTIGPSTPVTFQVVDIKGGSSTYTVDIGVTSDCGDFATTVTVVN